MASASARGHSSAHEALRSTSRTVHHYHYMLALAGYARQRAVSRKLESVEEPPLAEADGAAILNVSDNQQGTQAAVAG